MTTELAAFSPVRSRPAPTLHLVTDADASSRDSIVPATSDALTSGMRPALVARRRPRLESIHEFVRSTVAAVMGVAADLMVLEVLARALHVYPTYAKAVSMSVSIAVQFVASRRFAFRAHTGDLGQQIKWFMVCEAIGMVLILATFHALVRRVQLPIEAASLLSGAIVYLLFTYPMWKRIFRAPTEA